MPLRGNVTTLEVFRPVHGAKDFVTAARRIGGLVMGYDYSTSITTENHAKESGVDTALVSEPLGEPLLRVRNENRLSISLLYRQMPGDMNSHGRFSRAVNMVVRSKDGPTTGTIYDKMRRTAMEAGVNDPVVGEGVAVPIRCQNVDLYADSYDESPLKLAVRLSPSHPMTRVLYNQAILWNNAIGDSAKKAAFPSSGRPELAIPFANLPNAIDQDELTDVIRQLDREVSGLRLTIGGVVHRIIDRSQPTSLNGL